MGALTGGIIGFCIFLATGFTGIAMMVLFFVLGVLATSWKIKTKENIGAAERDKGKRTAGQVAANAGVAGLLGLLILLFPAYQFFLQLMLAASFSSATADTLSSELGTVYGKRFYNILSFKKDRRGENGVVSLEGTLFGLSGSVLIALVYAIAFGWNIYFFFIVIAGTVGNLADSILGAALERKQLIKNNAVNFLNTLIGALIGGLLVLLF